MGGAGLSLQAFRQPVQLLCTIGVEREYLGSSAGGMWALKQHPLLLSLLAEGA